MPDHATWDYDALAEQARRDIGEIEPLINDVLTPDRIAQVMDQTRARTRRSTMSSGCGSCTLLSPRARTGPPAIDHLADMFVPLYMWRAAAFMSHTALEPPAVVQSRLDSLCETFERLKPVLVSELVGEV